MAKLTKSALKSIVKECLVEILSEGLARDSSLVSETRALPVNESRATRRPKARKAPKVKNENFDRAVSRNVSSLTSDPMMAALFEDTARGTYQDQLEGDSRPGAVSQQETAAPGADLSDVFGDQAAANWASLAFGDSPKNS
tara:strand:+ start:219 stop:641 length:423 start_codon:yes stop_codon:yes gene_type:complete